MLSPMNEPISEPSTLMSQPFLQSQSQGTKPSTATPNYTELGSMSEKCPHGLRHWAALSLLVAFVCVCVWLGCAALLGEDSQCRAGVASVQPQPTSSLLSA